MENNVISNNAIVLYFDIFGFSNIVKNSDAPDNLVNGILIIWNKIASYLSNKEFETKIYFFSDCGFLIYPMHNSFDIPMDTILSKAYEDAIVLLDIFLEEGFFIRGAFSYGMVSYTSNLIVGEPVIDAVRLESLCPGPFVILPYKVSEHFIQSDSLLQDVPPPEIINLKENNKILCNKILPTNRSIYLRKIKAFYELYTKYGPFDYAKFWHDVYLSIKGTENIELLEVEDYG